MVRSKNPAAPADPGAAAASGTSAAPGASLPDAELTELAGEIRTFWRSLSRGTHLSGGTEVYSRQAQWVLGMLATGPRRMSDLAQSACTSQASVTGIVDRLEERGFVARIRSEDDRRVVEVSLTEAGLAEKHRLHREVADRIAELLEPLTPDERKELSRLFRKMTGGAPDYLTENLPVPSSDDSATTR